MTEEQWLSAKEPAPLVEFLAGRASDRKLRLFSCACCRRAWHFAKDERLNDVLRTVEGFADGTAKDRQRGKAHVSSAEVGRASGNHPQSCLGWELWKASKKTLDRRDPDFGESAAAAFGWAVRGKGDFFQAKSAELAQQVPLVREMFGNPFRALAFSPEWRTDTALSLGRQMYASREFGGMPILADALQDAGCDSEELLSHLRDTTATHVRGCWALDLVLGKE